MRVLTPLVCLLLVLVAAASIVHRAKSTGAQHQAHAAAPVLPAHQHHRVAKSINPKIHAAATSNTHSKKVVDEEEDGSLLAKALFEDVHVAKKAAAAAVPQPSHQKLVHSKKLLRDLEEDDVEAELNKVLAAEKDLEAVKEGLSSLTSELKGIETAIRATEESKAKSKVVVEESSIPAASTKKDILSPVSTESESKALDAVLTGANDVSIQADNKIVTSSEETNNVVAPVTKAEESSNSDETPAVASADENGDASENVAENEPEVAASAESEDEQKQQLESVPASADSTENAVDEDQVQEGDSSASFLEISKSDAGEESLVEQLTRSRMNMHNNKRLAAMRLAETAAENKDESDSDKKVTDDSAIVITRAGKHVPVDGTGYFKDITKPYVNEIANTTAGENTTDTDVVCVCKRSGAPRGEDRVRCKKHAKPSPSPSPSAVVPAVPVGIRQCATGRWPNGTVPDGGSTDTICIYFPSKIDIPTPTPIPTPPVDEPEYPPECFDERNEFVAPGVEKRPYDVLLLQEGFETCGC